MHRFDKNEAMNKRLSRKQIDCAPKKKKKKTYKLHIYVKCLKKL